MRRRTWKNEYQADSGGRQSQFCFNRVMKSRESSDGGLLKKFEMRKGSGLTISLEFASHTNGPVLIYYSSLFEPSSYTCCASGIDFPFGGQTQGYVPSTGMDGVLVFWYSSC